LTDDETLPTQHEDYDPAANDPMRLDNLGRRAQDSDRRYFIHADDHGDIINPDNATNAVKVKFLGCNSLYITDGTTKILIDPFFSRPRASMSSDDERERLIEPDRGIIQRTLDHAGITEADAIFMSHAHWDHAQDIAEVWHQLNGENPRTMIYGSSSIERITRGHVHRRGDEVTPAPVPDEFMETDVDRRIFDHGDFRIAFLPGAHGPLPRSAHEAGIGDIEEDLVPPVRVDAFKQGPMYDFIIQHRDHGTILNKGSTNFVRGLLQDLMDAYVGDRDEESEEFNDANVDAIILGIAGYNWLWGRAAVTAASMLILPFIGPAVLEHLLGGSNALEVHRHFWREIITPTNPYMILFSHWEDFQEGRSNMLDRAPHWMMGSKALGLFRRRRRREGRRFRTGRRHSLRNRPMPIHYIPLWEEITVLPQHRRPSLFRLPEGDRLTEIGGNGSPEGQRE
jgi:hypothetical protein